MAGIQLANMVANVVDRDGMKIFTVGPTSDLEVEALLVDLVGRSKAVTVPDNTVMVIVPAGDHGALIFDPCSTRDAEGRYVLGQRTLVSRLEIGQMIDQALADRAKAIVRPVMGDIMKFGVN